MSLGLHMGASGYLLERKQPVIYGKRQESRGHVLSPNYLDTCRGILTKHILPKWKLWKLEDITASNPFVVRFKPPGGEQSKAPLVNVRSVGRVVSLCPLLCLSLVSGSG
jgi:hypothetical protein